MKKLYHKKPVGRVTDEDIENMTMITLRDNDHNRPVLAAREE